MGCFSLIIITYKGSKESNEESLYAHWDDEGISLYLRLGGVCKLYNFQFYLEKAKVRDLVIW